MRNPRLAATALGLLSILLAAVTLPGCGKPAEAEAAQPQQTQQAEAYAGPPAFTVINNGRRTIRGVAVRTNLMMSFRDLGPGESSTLSSKSLEITDKVEVRWTDQSGEHHYVKKPTSRLGRGVAHIRLVIDGSNRVDITR